MLDTDPTTRSPAEPTPRPPVHRSVKPVRGALAVAALVATLVVGGLVTGDGPQPRVPGVDATADEPTADERAGDERTEDERAEDGDTEDQRAEDELAQDELPEVSPLLAWAPPELTDPETVEVSASKKDLKLDPDRDYVVRMPDEPLDVVGGLRINGGRNVVLIGGEIRISKQADEARKTRGLYLRNQTGTLHVEGLHIGGAALGEGINLDQRRGATVQLQNIRVDGVQGAKDRNHADLLQTWAGPSVLRVDHFTGSTSYQGFFLLPQQFGDQDEPEAFDFRNVNIVGGDDAGYLLWRDGGDWPVSAQNVWVTPERREDRDQLIWDTDDDLDTWDDVRIGEPPAGDFVPEGVAGVGYRPPGYQDRPDDGS